MTLAIPSLETPRLRLRPYCKEDFEAYAAMYAEPGVVRFISGAPLSREASWIRFLRQIGMWHYMGFGFFAFEEKATGAFVGEGGFHDLHRALVPSIEGTLEAGWALAGAAQGRGLAQEAMRAALAWADEQRGAERITCIIRPDHGASLRVASRLGFHEVARAIYSGEPTVIMERTRPSMKTAFSTASGQLA